MIKVFLKHWIFEKCISCIFDGITKNFTNNRVKDGFIGIKTERKNYKTIKTLSYRHNGEIYTISSTYSDDIVQEFMKQGMSEDQVHNMLEKELKGSVEFELKMQKDPTYFEKHPEELNPYAGLTPEDPTYFEKHPEELPSHFTNINL